MPRCLWDFIVASAEKPPGDPVQARAGRELAVQTVGGGRRRGGARTDDGGGEGGAVVAEGLDALGDAEVGEEDVPEGPGAGDPRRGAQEDQRP